MWVETLQMRCVGDEMGRGQGLSWNEGNDWGERMRRGPVKGSVNGGEIHWYVFDESDVTYVLCKPVSQAMLRSPALQVRAERERDIIDDKGGDTSKIVYDTEWVVMRSCDNGVSKDVGSRVAGGREEWKDPVWEVDTESKLWTTR